MSWYCLCILLVSPSHIFWYRKVYFTKSRDIYFSQTWFFVHRNLFDCKRDDIQDLFLRFMNSAILNSSAGDKTPVILGYMKCKSKIAPRDRWTRDTGKDWPSVSTRTWCFHVIKSQLTIVPLGLFRSWSHNRSAYIRKKGLLPTRNIIMF